MTSKPPDSLQSDGAIKSGGLSETLQSCTHYIDQHLQLFRSGSTVLACVGLFYVTRSIRMFKKFIFVSDIPKEFVRKHVRLRGRVTSVEEYHLTIEHLPIINLPRLATQKTPDKIRGLKVNLAGVKLLEGSREFLQKQIPVGHLTWFQMLAVDEGNKHLHAIVTYKQNWRKTVNLNEAVVHQGYGKVIALPDHTNKKLAVKITQKLIKAELVAEKKRQGVWHHEETRLARWMGVMHTSWNGTVYEVRGIFGVGVKIVRAPVTGYRVVREFIGKFKKR